MHIKRQEYLQRYRLSSRTIFRSCFLIPRYHILVRVVVDEVSDGHGRMDRALSRPRSPNYKHIRAAGRVITVVKVVGKPITYWFPRR